MKLTVRVIYIIALIVFSIWLFYQNDAAQPGSLLGVHEENAVCADCHTPWRGVSNEACLGCHAFYDTAEIREDIRFHEAELYCLNCHTEHRGVTGRISRMDHTLLNSKLKCSTCHFDPHERLFGQNCRACHGLSGWSIPGYRHPLAERGNCEQCHRPPLSHKDPLFWERLEVRHKVKIGDDEEVSPEQCWQCHGIHDWQHLRM